MEIELKPVQRGLVNLINRYQDGVRRDGGVPQASEFVKRCLTRYGLPGAFQAYVRINAKRASDQRVLLERNFSDEKVTPERLKRVEDKLLSLLFGFVITPIETAATMVGQGRRIQKFNRSLGAADWGGDEGGGGGGSDSNDQLTQTDFDRANAAIARMSAAPTIEISSSSEVDIASNHAGPYTDIFKPGTGGST